VPVDWLGGQPTIRSFLGRGVTIRTVINGMTFDGATTDPALASGWAMLSAPSKVCFKRPNRERENLVGERTRIVNRMKGGLLDAAPYLFSKVEASGHGTGKLPTDVLDSLDFVAPDDRTRCLGIIQPLDALNDKIAANHTEGGTLVALRDMLLPKLMSGEIRVKDAEKIAEAAL
jgi:hypothetical protein